MTIPDDWVCYATRCYKPYPPGFALDLLMVGSAIGAIVFILGVLIIALVRAFRK